MRQTRDSRQVGNRCGRPGQTGTLRRAWQRALGHAAKQVSGRPIARARSPCRSVEVRQSDRQGEAKGATPEPLFVPTTMATRLILPDE